MVLLVQLAGIILAIALIVLPAATGLQTTKKTLARDARCRGAGNGFYQWRSWLELRSRIAGWSCDYLVGGGKLLCGIVLA